MVRAPRQDSDLAPLGDERRRFLRESLNARDLPAEKAPLTAAITAARTGTELHMPILALAGGLVALESWLAGRWSSV